MADASVQIHDSTGANVAIDTRTAPNGDERQVFLLGEDGTDNLVPVATETTLASVLAAVGGVYGYAAGTAAGTVDVPTGARVRRVSVLAASGAAATVAIAGGDTITIPAGSGFDDTIPGDVSGDVVIGGSVAAYYVGWVA